jgi:hypothetical protein
VIQGHGHHSSPQAHKPTSPQAHKPTSPQPRRDTICSASRKVFLQQNHVFLERSLLYSLPTLQQGSGRVYRGLQHGYAKTGMPPTMKWKVRQRTALPTSRPLTISAWTVSIADMQPTEGQEGDPEERPQTARSRSDDLMD